MRTNRADKYLALLEVHHHNQTINIAFDVEYGSIVRQHTDIPVD
jgi:hypothetical protein